MLSYLLLILLVSPFIGAGTIVFLYSQSLLSVVAVGIGAIVGAVLITGSGIAWLQSLHGEWMQTQAAGFIFLPVTVPLCAYVGAISRASLVAFLYSYSRNNESTFLFWIVAMVFTVVLSGLIPSAIFGLPSFDTSINVSGSATALFVAILGGVASSWFASELAYLLVASLCRITLYLSPKA